MSLVHDCDGDSCWCHVLPANDNGRPHAREAVQKLKAARAFVAMAIDHVERAFLPDATPEQRRARIETGASDIASAARAVAEAGCALAYALVRP